MQLFYDILNYLQEYVIAGIESHLPKKKPPEIPEWKFYKHLMDLQKISDESSVQTIQQKMTASALLSEVTYIKENDVCESL